MARELRVDEIQRALASVNFGEPPGICVVPVRMTEAWFLFNEDAIRRASGNPSGLAPLQLPAFQQVEARPATKELLYDVLRTASELGGRRLKKFRPERAVHRLAELITDYSPLRNLSAFEALEGELSEMIRMRWME